MKSRTPILCDRCRASGYLGEGEFTALAPVLDFAPVPRRTKRHDGWTPERQRGFIEALARTGSVSQAAAAVNMAKEGAYQLRLHPKAAEFRRAWSTALDYGTRVLADAALDRAIHGVPVPIMHGGKQVGERRVYNERLTLWHLQHRTEGGSGSAPRIGRGTRHPDTIARERDALQSAEAQQEEQAKTARGIADLLAVYMERVGLERRHRDAGETRLADFYSRQLTHIEILFEVGGALHHLMAATERYYFPDRPWTRVHGETLRKTWLTGFLASARAEAWKLADEGRSEEEIGEHLIATRDQLRRAFEGRKDGAPIKDPQ